MTLAMRIGSIWVLILAAGMLLAAGCGGGAEEKAPFLPGIYYRQPDLDSFDTVLTKLEGPLPRQISWSGAGFDIRSDAVVFTDNDKVFLVDPDGRERRITAEGIFQMVRPSLSPDGERVAVQAAESPGGDLNIYTVDLKTGKAARISFLSVNEESPEWFPNQNKIAYTSFHPVEGLTLHVYDVDAGKEVLSIKDGGSIHLAVSPDGSLLFNPTLARLYDAATGKVVSDLKDKVLAGLEALGYKPDTRFPGQAGKGTFPLDADFSPDGSHIVFDGAVEHDGTYGLVIFRMTITGADVTPLTDIIEVDPSFSNNNNFSQLNPSWLGD